MNPLAHKCKLCGVGPEDYPSIIHVDVDIFRPSGLQSTKGVIVNEYGQPAFLQLGKEILLKPGEEASIYCPEMFHFQNSTSTYEKD